MEETHPDLVLLDIEAVENPRLSLPEQYPEKFETIIMHPIANEKPIAIASEAIGHLFRPIQTKELLAVIANACHRINLKREWFKCRQLLAQLYNQSPPNNLIGIPVMEGMEFLKACEIIRCEGLQQFTRVVLTEGNGIISSYNIGKFCDLLLPYGFFAPHKSHLINLQHIRKYMQEGTIVMRDGSFVPVSRRRKGLFFQRVKHL